MSILSKPDQAHLRTAGNKRLNHFAVRNKFRTLFFTVVLGIMLTMALFLTGKTNILSRNSLTPQNPELWSHELFPSWLAWLYYS